MSEGSAPGHLGERKLTAVHAIGQSLAIGPMFSAGLLTGLVASVAVAKHGPHRCVGASFDSHASAEA